MQTFNFNFSFNTDLSKDMHSNYPTQQISINIYRAMYNYARYSKNKMLNVWNNVYV